MYGNPGLMTSQILSALVAAVIGFVGTTIIYYAIKLAQNTFRVNAKEEEAGLAVTQHDEKAYVTEN